MVGIQENEFIKRRSFLLKPKQQSALELAKEIVELFELIAIHGSSGIGGDPEKRNIYIELFTRRIIASTEPDH